MGLAVSVGDYSVALREGDDTEWMDEQFALVNSVLMRNGLPQHHEPSTVPEVNYSSCIGFPYSFLHYLRRIYARSRLGKSAEPVSGDDITAEDEKDIEQVSELADSHLLYHSDCEGLYLPMELKVPLVDDDLPGGALGSTQGLLKELEAIASLIDIEFVDGAPTEASLESLAEFNEDHPYHIERVVWHSLFENCQLSMKFGAAIVFG